MKINKLFIFLFLYIFFVLAEYHWVFCDWFVLRSPGGGYLRGYEPQHGSLQHPSQGHHSRVHQRLRLRAFPKQRYSTALSTTVRHLCVT